LLNKRNLGGNRREGLCELSERKRKGGEALREGGVCAPKGIASQASEKYRKNGGNERKAGGVRGARYCDPNSRTTLSDNPDFKALTVVKKRARDAAFRGPGVPWLRGVGGAVKKDEGTSLQGREIPDLRYAVYRSDGPTEKYTGLGLGLE